MHHSWDFPRNISAIRVLVSVGQLHGLSVDACLTNAGISTTDLSRLDHEVEAWQECQVIRNLLAKLGNQLPLGVAAGLKHHTTTFGAWGFAVLSSCNIEAALNIAVRYLQLSSVFCRLETIKEGEKTLLMIDHSELPEDLQYFLAERDFTTLMSLQQDILPVQLPVIQIDVALPAPVYADKFPELTGYAINFDQPRSCIIIESRLLELPLPQADQFTLARYEEECQHLLARRGTLGSYSQKIRNILLLQPAHMPKIQEMADSLEINLRTLQRQLAVEGITYERLVEGIREDLAEDLLKTTDLTIEEIANRLGYSEVSAFSRAFKRWKNISPKNFRSHLSTFKV